MKFYSKSTLQHWTKKELIEYIECLQKNLSHEEKWNNHMYSTITAVMKKDPAVSKAVCEVLDIWNKSGGQRYNEVD